MVSQKGDPLLAVIMIGSFVVAMIVAGYFLFTLSGYSPAPTQNNQQSQIPPNDQTAHWNTATNNDAGFSFRYPADFGSKYASFNQTPVAIVTAGSDSNIDNKGCYAIADSGNSNNEFEMTINTIPFCVSSASSPGAGQLYNTRNYTTQRNGSYITLQYVVHTLNGCGPYMGTPDYQPCTDFLNNYDTNVVKVIEQSVATLQFTK